MTIKKLKSMACRGAGQEGQGERRSKESRKKKRTTYKVKYDIKKSKHLTKGENRVGNSKTILQVQCTIKMNN